MSIAEKVAAEHQLVFGVVDDSCSGCCWIDPTEEPERCDCWPEDCTFAQHVAIITERETREAVARDIEAKHDAHKSEGDYSYGVGWLNAMSAAARIALKHTTTAKEHGR